MLSLFLLQTQIGTFCLNYQNINTNISFSMMINNNPYNLPQRPPNKQNRVYAQSNTTQFRPSQIVQNSTPYAQYIARQGTAIPQKKNSLNSINVQQNGMNYRPQNYTSVRPQIMHYLPSPKNVNSSANNQHSVSGNYSFTNNRGANNISSSVDKKQIGNLRQSFGVTNIALPAHDIKELNQKIQSLEKSFKATQRRIVQLQKNSNSTNFLPNNSKSLGEDNLGNNSNLFNSSGQTHPQLLKYQIQLNESISRVMDQIQNVKDQIRNVKLAGKYGMGLDIQKMVSDKCRQFFQFNKTIQTSNNYINRSSQDQYKRQMESNRMVLEQKLKKNYDFLTSVIGRVQRELHSSMSNIQPNYKPSPIKCSSTAILLRFVQCFKVRKHSTTIKSGQIKITLTDNTYYIDNEGYLLDKEQFYIVDSRDCRVRLQEKHIKLLKDQNILI